MHGKHHNPDTATVAFDLLADAERARVKARVQAKLASQGFRPWAATLSPDTKGPGAGLAVLTRAAPIAGDQPLPHRESYR